MRITSWFAGIALLALSGAFVTAQANPLDGKTFTGEMGKAGETKGDADNFIFRGGTFRSTACDKYGYGDGAYSLRQQGDTQVFESMTRNPDGNVFTWKGTVTADTVEGSALLKMADGSTKDFWFKGKLTTVAMASSLLDGKMFTVLINEKGGSKTQPDDLVFKSGTFRSTACDQYGFMETAYTASTEAGITTFEAVAHSDKSGTITWKGKVSGDTVEGTEVWDPAWWRPNKQYAFKGSLKH